MLSTKSILYHDVQVLIILLLLLMLAASVATLGAQPQNYVVTMASSQEIVVPGEQFTLTISVTNNAQSDNVGGTIDFYLPENELAVVQVLDGGRQLVGAPHVVTWGVASGFAANTTITRRVVVKVPPSTTGGQNTNTSAAPAAERAFKVVDFWYADLKTDQKYMGSPVEIRVDLGPGIGIQVPRAWLPAVVR